MIKDIAKRLLASTPYEIRKRERKSRLPLATLDAVRIILAYYSARGGDTIFVQIGAYDGSTKDPVHDFVKMGKMKAILVEPMPYSFAKLEKAYANVTNISLVQAAIAEKDGEVVMYKVREGGRWDDSIWTPQLASFDKGHLISHGVRENEIETVTVRALTLSSLAQMHQIKTIDILQIDAEGFDSKIVAMAMALPQKPYCINFENLHFTPEETRLVFGLLEKNGYSFIHDHWNSLAIHKDLERQWVNHSYPK